MLTDKDCENVYELVYSSHRGVAQAAGEFLNAKLFVHDLDETTRNLRTANGKKRGENTSRIRDMILFFIESEVCTSAVWLHRGVFSVVIRTSPCVVLANGRISPLCFSTECRKRQLMWVVFCCFGMLFWV